MSSSGLQDSPLSITSSIAGILTFVVALAAAAYVRITYLRNAEQEYFQVKASLNWYKTESAWMYDLVNAAEMRKARSGNEKEYQIYTFVMEQLVKLEERLLSLLTEAEIEAYKRPQQPSHNSWTFIPRKYQQFMWPSTTATTVSWIPIRTKALELVRQRDALGSRVLFAQLSMISSVLDQESRARKDEAVQMDRLEELERLVYHQTEKLESLELLINRLFAPDSGSKLDVQSSTNGVVYQDDYPSRDLTRENTLVEELQRSKILTLKP